MHLQQATIKRQIAAIDRFPNVVRASDYTHLAMKM